MAIATSWRSLVVAAFLAARARNPAGPWAVRLTSAAATSSAGESFLLGAVEDLAGGRDVAADQAAEQDLEVRGHALTVVTGADDPLTAT